MRSIFNFISFQTVVLSAFAVYVSILSNTIWSILDPARGIEYENADGVPLPVLEPLWMEGSTYKVTVYLSSSPNVRSRHGVYEKLWTSESVPFSRESELQKEFDISRSEIGDIAWMSLAQNRSLYIHFKFVNEKSSDYQPLWATSPLVKWIHETPKIPKKFLVKDWPFLGIFVPEDNDLKQIPASGSELLVGYWQPVASARLVADWTIWPIGSTPSNVMSGLRLPRPKSNKYLPVIYSDQLGVTKDNMVQLNKTNKDLKLVVKVGPRSLARWQLSRLFEQALEDQRKLGMSDKEVDVLEQMLAGTEPLLLAVTACVTLIHILLDILAFKSDISFWKNVESSKGLSVKTMLIDLISKVIITAYLHSEDASLLVLVPNAIGAIIQLWKLKRAYSIGGADDTESKLTEEVDTFATTTLSLFLVPVIASYSVYSLVRNKHSSFYGWAIESLASCVFGFGFAMMLPQVYINYRLKSVAHLPWRFFVYKFLNTIIDDLFAFIIRMPTLHRLSVFRDDFVFVILCFQLWRYPVDLTRKHEFESKLSEVDNKDEVHDTSKKNQ